MCEQVQTILHFAVIVGVVAHARRCLALQVFASARRHRTERDQFVRLAVFLPFLLTAALLYGRSIGRVGDAHAVPFFLQQVEPLRRFGLFGRESG